MCDTQQSSIGHPAIYSVPISAIEMLQSKILASAKEDSDEAMSVEFTSNGSLYLGGVSSTPPPAADGAPRSYGVHVFGVSPADGTLTGINVNKISVVNPPSENANSIARQIFMEFNMTQPVDTPRVGFIFDVNANSAMLKKVTYSEDGRSNAVDFAKALCVAKNGGTSILKVLIESLPSLIGGPEAFLAAVSAKVPGAAINTAQTVIEKCFI